jgi:uncharacterized protein involved in exopolysaccharide biosynthesis
MESENPKQLVQNEISLKELFDILWRGRWLIVSTTLVVTLVAGIAAWLTPKTYQATIVISPVSENSSNQLSGMNSITSQFAGLASSLTGISVGGDSKKAESLAVLQSEALTEKYIKDNGLLPVLFQNKWDNVAGKWKVSDPEKIPTLWKANEFFKKQVRVVTNNAKTGLVTLTISWKNPEVAAKWANDLVQMTNEYLRSKAIAQSERNIAYLTEQAAKTDAVGVRQAVYSILQTEINKVMLARGSDEYAFRVLDAAVPPERASAPQKLLWTLGGFVVGLSVSVFIVLIRVGRNS